MYFWSPKWMPSLLCVWLALSLSMPAGSAPASVTAADRMDWIEARSAHFTFFSSISEKPVRTIAQGMETLRAVLQTLRSTGGNERSRLPEQTYVYVFSHERLFNDYRERKEVAGWFASRQDGNYIALLTGQEGIQQMIFHEYMHYFLHAYFLGLPSWLDEGMAEVYSTLKIDDQNAVLGGPAVGRFSTLQTFKPIPMDQFLQMSNPLHSQEDAIEGSRFYAQAWLLSHYLILGGGQERNQQLQAYVRFLAQGMSSKEAFAKAFPISAEALGEELSTYLKRILFQRMIPIQRLVLKNLSVDPAFSSHALPKDQVQARLGMLAAVMPQKRDQAKRHFQAALEMDPTCPLAHLGLGRLVWASGNYRAAYEEHFSQVTDLPAEDADLQFKVGEFEYYAAGSEEKLDFEKLAKARKHLFQNMKRLPGQSPAMNLLQRSFLRDPEHVPEGIAMIDSAMKAEPARWDYAALLAGIYLDHKEPDKAVPLLRKVADQTEDASSSQWARALISQREDQGGRDGLAEGMRLLREEKLAEALTVLQLAQTRAKDPDLQQRIQSILKMVQLQVEQAKAAELAAGAKKKTGGNTTKARKSR